MTVDSFTLTENTHLLHNCFDSIIFGQRTLTFFTTFRVPHIQTKNTYLLQNCFNSLILLDREHLPFARLFQFPHIWDREHSPFAQLFDSLISKQRTHTFCITLSIPSYSDREHLPFTQLFQFPHIWTENTHLLHNISIPSYLNKEHIPFA